MPVVWKPVEVSGALNKSQCANAGHLTLIVSVPGQASTCPTEWTVLFCTGQLPGLAKGEVIGEALAKEMCVSAATVLAEAILRELRDA